ncbi:unnamed protein product [Penicillium olsonii]|nr:unnamed protein product [Penicillium olsonii]CAG7922558.1 unnamed protein product [Penicillium olsonii]
MDYSFPAFPIPASIRRRLPRLYSAGRKDLPDLHRGLASASEPQLCNVPIIEGRDSRPTTASDDLDFDSGSRGYETPPEEMASPTKYEAESGLRWNRVVPAFNLLRNAGFEAQQPHADGRLARSLYVNALVYLLDALPPDLSDEETTMLQHHIPGPVKASLTYPPRYVDRDPRPCRNSRSYLHKVLASLILQLFILLRFVLPYVRLFLRQVYEYERTHRITERVLTATLDAADGLGKGGVNIGASVCRLNEGRVGAALSNFAAWWMEGVAGGIYEGVGEGMMHLGITGQGVELDFPHSMNQ